MDIHKITMNFPMELLLLADPSEELIQVYLDNGQCFIAVEGDETIGVFVLLPLTNETVELKNIAVHDDHQGKGIGKELVLHAIEKSKELGFQKIEVGTGNSSLNQLALYQKCGFRIVSVDKDFFKIHYTEEIVENGVPCVDMIRLEK
ncbi:MAG: GNAT family N-acetyltransferase, partial [Psychrobacillus sp.]